MPALRIYMGGPTSLPTAGFASAEAALMGLSAYGVGPLVGPGPGLVTATSLAQATGFSSDSITYTDYVMPTGAGWTDGTNSIAATQAWLNGIPDGADATHHTRVILGAGVTRTWSEALNVLNRRYITFWGGGTPVHTTQTTPLLGLQQILTTGNVGGCTIRITSGGLSGHVGRNAAFAMTTYGIGFRATGLRWVGIQFQGNGMTTPTTGLANQGNENQHGLALYGLDGGEVLDCTFVGLKGDGIAFLNANGAYDQWPPGSGIRPDLGDAPTRIVSVKRCWIKTVGRVGLFPGDYENVLVEDVRIEDTGFAFIDFEPDYFHMRPGSWTARRVTLAGRCNWTTSFYMAPIFITRVTGRSPGETWSTTGPMSFDQFVFDNTHGRNGSGTSPAAGATSDWPWEVQAYLGPITKPFPFSFTNSERTRYPHTQSFMQAAGFTAGITVTNCRGFGVTNPATSFVTSTGGTNPGGITQSGNS